MKHFLVKIACIAGAGAVAAFLWGDILAGVLIAPFGWLIGKAMEMKSRMPEEEKRLVPVRREEEDEEWRRWNEWNEEWWEEIREFDYRSAIPDYPESLGLEIGPDWASR